MQLFYGDLEEDMTDETELAERKYDSIDIFLGFIAALLVLIVIMRIALDVYFGVL